MSTKAYLGAILDEELYQTIMQMPKEKMNLCLNDEIGVFFMEQEGKKLIAKEAPDTTLEALELLKEHLLSVLEKIYQQKIETSFMLFQHGAADSIR